MAVAFKVTRHDIRNVYVIEVWVDGQFRATIYPEGQGIRLVSSYLTSVDYRPGDPMAMDFRFGNERTKLAKVIKGTGA